MPPFFSVVIPTFNRAPLLRETLASVFAQETDDFEILVADDGSTDDTLRWLASNCPRARVLNQSNMGPGAARNLGIRNASGRYVAFLDSDDLWFPWTLSTMKAVISQADAPAWVMGKALQFHDSSSLESLIAGPLRFAAFS